MSNLETKLARMEALAAQRESVVYALLHRNAGWAVQWWEAARCTTPQLVLPERGGDPRPLIEILADMRALNDCSEARLREGLVVYAYKPTLIEAVEAEIERLLQTPTET